jgi:hypothetical protein
VEPFGDSVWSRTHDCRGFAIERSKQIVFDMQLFNIPPQDIYSIHDFAEVLVRLHSRAKRPRSAHFQLRNKQAFGKIIGSVLQLSVHAGIIAVPVRRTMPSFCCKIALPVRRMSYIHST